MTSALFGIKPRSSCWTSDCSIHYAVELIESAWLGRKVFKTIITCWLFAPEYMEGGSWQGRVVALMAIAKIIQR